MSFVFKNHARATAAPNVLSSIAAFGCWLGLLPQRKAEPQQAGSTPPKNRPSRQEMLQAGNDMLQRARLRHQPLTLLMFHMKDLPELQGVFGARAAKTVASEAKAKLRQIAGRRGMVLRTEPTLYTVILPGLDRDAALAAAQHAMGESCCIEVEADGDDIVLVPRVLVHTLRDDDGPLEQIIDSVRKHSRQPRVPGQHHPHAVAPECEAAPQPLTVAASEPKPKPALLEDQPDGRSVYPFQPATVPIPIAMR